MRMPRGFVCEPARRPAGGGGLRAAIIDTNLNGAIGVRGAQVQHDRRQGVGNGVGDQFRNHHQRVVDLLLIQSPGGKDRAGGVPGSRRGRRLVLQRQIKHPPTGAEASCEERGGVVVWGVIAITAVPGVRKSWPGLC